MDYAVAVNEEIRDLKAAGADVIQLDEPWMQAFPEQAAALRRARPSTARWRGSPAPPWCISASAMPPWSTDKPSGYSFLPELADSDRASRSRSRRRSRGSTSASSATCRQDDHARRDRPRRARGRDAGDGGRPHPRRAAPLPAERLVVAPDCGMKYLPRDRAFGKLKAMAEGAAIVRRELAG